MEERNVAATSCEETPERRIIQVAGVMRGDDMNHAVVTRELESQRTLSQTSSYPYVELEMLACLARLELRKVENLLSPMTCI